MNEFIARNGLIAQNKSTITGSLNVTGGITGSLLGTASFATTASYVTLAQTASYVVNAQTASYVTTAQTASYVTTSQTSSYVTTSQTASFVTASAINGILPVANGGTSYVGGAWTVFSSTITGFSGTPTQVITYITIGKLMFVSVSISGTSNTTSFSFTIPSNALSSKLYIGRGFDNTSTIKAASCETIASSNVVNVYSNNTQAVWTGSNIKSFTCMMIVELQ